MQPLADQLRPSNLDDFIGQGRLVDKGKPLRIALERKKIFSMIFWGPPGVGKTTLARIFAKENEREFIELSAVSAGKADIREIVENTRKQRTLTQSYTPPILFLDEIHRFNKAQQDYLLPHVERGTLTLIGATTENPSFEIISPLLSRARVFVFEELKDKDLDKLVTQALKKLKISYPKLKIKKDAREWLISYANGDARKLLTIIDNTLSLYENLEISSFKSSVQSQFLRFDKKGEEHYNTISAFIKSMRASDPDAAVYYLARMIEAGEDPLFIARRMVVFASEDIGMAQPTALVVANEVFQSCQFIGYPECSINLAHGVVYLALAKKNRGAYNALRAAQADVKKQGNLPIPLHLRNAPTKLMKELKYGDGYEKYPDKDKNLLPKKLKSKKYYKT